MGGLLWYGHYRTCSRKWNAEHSSSHSHRSRVKISKISKWNTDVSLLENGLYTGKQYWRWKSPYSTKNRDRKKTQRYYLVIRVCSKSNKKTLSFTAFPQVCDRQVFKIQDIRYKFGKCVSYAIRKTINRRFFCIVFVLWFIVSRKLWHVTWHRL